MATVNKVILIGRLGKDPELKYLPSGTPLCSFSLATSESYTDKQGKKVENTEWHNIVIWEKLAEVANQFLKKGSQVYLEGKLKYENYEKDGVKKTIAKIVAKELVFLDAKELKENKPEPAKVQTFESDNSFEDDKDVPF